MFGKYETPSTQGQHNKWCYNADRLAYGFETWCYILDRHLFGLSDQGKFKYTADPGIALIYWRSITQCIGWLNVNLSITFSLALIVSMWQRTNLWNTNSWTKGCLKIPNPKSCPCLYVARHKSVEHKQPNNKLFENPKSLSLCGRAQTCGAQTAEQ